MSIGKGKVHNERTSSTIVSNALLNQEMRRQIEIKTSPSKSKSIILDDKYATRKKYCYKIGQE